MQEEPPKKSETEEQVEEREIISSIDEVTIGSKIFYKGESYEVVKIENGKYTLKGKGFNPKIDAKKLTEMILAELSDIEEKSKVKIEQIRIENENLQKKLAEMRPETKTGKGPQSPNILKEKNLFLQKGEIEESSTKNSLIRLRGSSTANAELLDKKNKIHQSKIKTQDKDIKDQKDKREIETSRQEEIDQRHLKAKEEDKKINPFKYFVIEKMSDQAFLRIFQRSKNNAFLESINSKLGENGKDAEPFEELDPQRIQARDNTVYMSPNGFTLILQNIDDVKTKKGIDTHNPKARYILYTPQNDEFAKRKLNFEEGVELLKKMAGEYQKQLEEEFKIKNSDINIDI